MPTIWKDGRRVPGSPKELADQLRRFAGMSDSEFSIRSSWHAHLGERLNEAADEIERLARSAGEITG